MPLSVAKTLYDKIKVMINLERLRITYMTNGPGGRVVGEDPPYWQNLAVHNINAIRTINAWSPNFAKNFGGSSHVDDKFKYFIGCNILAQQNGVDCTLISLLDLCDIGQGDCGPTTMTALRDFLSYIKTSGLDPKKTIISPYSELVAGDNFQYNPIILDTHNLLRSILPEVDGWVAGVQGAWWDAPKNMLGDGSPSLPRARVSDDQAVYEGHYYPPVNIPQDGVEAFKKAYQDQDATLTQWSKANGNCLCALTEIGHWNGNMVPWGQKNPGIGAWPATITAIAQAIPGRVFAPWSATDGDDSITANPHTKDATLAPAVLAATAALNFGPPPVITVNVPSTTISGATTKIEVAANTPVIDIIVVSVVTDAAGKKSWPFRKTLLPGSVPPYDQLAIVDGKAVYSVVFTNDDFIKYGPPGGPYVDTPHVQVSTAPPATSIKVDAPSVAVSGVLSHVLVNANIQVVEIIAVDTVLDAAGNKTSVFQKPVLGGVGPYDQLTMVGVAGTYYPVTFLNGSFLEYGPPGGPYVDTPPVVVVAPPAVSADLTITMLDALHMTVTDASGVATVANFASILPAADGTLTLYTDSSRIPGVKVEIIVTK